MHLQDKAPTERNRELREGIQWIHMGSVDLDFADIIHVYSHSLTRDVVLTKDDTRGWSTDWDFIQVFRANMPREKNREITRLLRLAQEDLFAHKYGPKAGGALEFCRRYRTPTLAGGGRYQFFREPEFDRGYY